MFSVFKINSLYFTVWFLWDSLCLNAATFCSSLVVDRTYNLTSTENHNQITLAHTIRLSLSLSLRALLSNTLKAISALTESTNCLTVYIYIYIYIYIYVLLSYFQEFVGVLIELACRQVACTSSYILLLCTSECSFCLSLRAWWVFTTLNIVLEQSFSYTLLNCLWIYPVPNI
jgi:hypothetical protein